MADEKLGLRVIFNGEIYNYKKLRDRLVARGYRFRTDTDTEVLLYLYAEYGRDLVEHLRGMYAFALYEEEERRMLLARDPYGIKPLYYADDGHSLRLASQVSALRATGRVDTSPSPAGHVGFFLWGHVPEPHTMYSGIKAFPAGHTCWVDQQSGFRTPQPFETVTDVLLSAEREINGRPSEPNIREVLLDTVRHHLVADVDVGIFLSAGLDSATLVALAAEIGVNVKSVTLGFEEYRGTIEDEVPEAERIAERYGTDHATIWVTREDFGELRDGFFDSMDQPTIDGANSYLVSKYAAEAGLKVALSGLGGDELFGSYPSFSQIPRLVSTVGAVPGIEEIGKGFRAVAAPVLERVTSPKYASLLEYGGDYAGAYLLRRGLYMPWELPDVLDPGLVEQGWEMLRPRLRLGDTVDGIQDDHLRITALESCWYMRNQLLRDTDWASMAHSLEVRTPLVDRTLLQRLASMMARHDISKEDLASTPKTSLPKEVIERSKTGFTVPLREWLAEEQPDLAATRGARGWAQYVYQQKMGKSVGERVCS